MSDLTHHPRVQPDTYVVYPAGYDDFANSDRDAWCLSVVNGHAWGWSIRRGIGMSGSMAMNRQGKWIVESRASGRNKPRRWPLQTALEIALAHVDTHTLNGRTARQAALTLHAPALALDAAEAERRHRTCPCPRGERPLGRLYGINMGRGIVRLSTDPECPIHNEHACVGNGERCERCAESRVAWIHPETR